MDISMVMQAFQGILHPMMLLTIFIGVLVGIIAGCIPGFTFTMAIILAFPFTFGMDPVQGLALMIGIYIGGLSGGLISGILLGIPGTPSSVVTVFDGYPMTQQGQSARALGIGIASSVLGTFIGAIVLFLLGPIIAKFSLLFGPWEIFSLILFALTLVAGLSGASLVKGLLAGCLGLLIGTIGISPTGQVRFDFGISQLSSGFSPIPVLIGLFALSTLFGNIEEIKKSVAGKDTKILKQQVKIPYLQVIKDMYKERWNVLRSSLIGCFIGCLPAAGAESANFISYDQAKKFSKEKEMFGKGHPGGIVASESSNNAVAGGAFIPTITLGIPGDVAQAVMIGALILHGITPGPGLFHTQPVLVNSIYVAIIISGVAVLILQTLLLPILTRITFIPKEFLVPSILFLSTVGAFALNNQIFDIWIVFVFGIIGFLLMKMDVPLSPIILGLILGPTLEAEMTRAFQMDTSILLFFTRPISLTFLILALGSFVFTIIQVRKQNKETAEAIDIRKGA
ncbi:tripartite tricarboxylate transporter permease [Litchfieldia salsa]|uniref:Putative tricarboxylic transport membrane protein n=1 Tax=Litchfieldia salsa TaxID=930152 RepID=A0A1H0PSK3_9BACI|nr:tripartite tricarboxylate transporter permease [Litchfieldia salsa]SDP07974.1 putative tricarboxylic transport membrane protein [Litchfieldia salsa]